MSFVEILILSIGLAMDAVGVSMTNAMVFKNAEKHKYVLMPIFFGGFQAFMPLVGYLAGKLFVDFISRYSGIVIFVILGFIGGKMIFDAIKEKRHPEEVKEKKLTVWMLFVQAIATSIDALAVGVGFTAAGTNIAVAVSCIGIVTALLVCAAIFVGRKFGNRLGVIAQFFGGGVLIFIGIKALF